MGCGCNKGKTNGNINRQTIYQVLSPQGEVLSEHETSTEARTAANSAGGRVRVTSRTKASV